MSAITEEVLAALVGSVITDDHGTSESLVLQAIFHLSEGGMQIEEALLRVQDVLTHLEEIL